MESGEFLEPNPSFMGDSPSPRAGRKSHQYLLFSILCILFKSEAIFTFFVYWVRGLELTSGTVGIPDFNTLSHLWLLKPLFSLVIDKFNVPLPAHGAGYGGAVGEGGGGSEGDLFSQLGINNYRLVILIFAEYTLALSSVIVYLLYAFDCLHLIFANFFIYAAALSLVCASSYAEGLFCRFVHNRPTESYSKLISLRLIMSALYGLTTVSCLLLPILFRGSRLSRFLQINVFFPLFLIFNAVLITFLIAKSRKDAHHLASPIVSPINSAARKAADESSRFSLQILLSLLLLLLISIRLRNDFFNRYSYSGVDHYVFVISTQFFKLVTSAFIYYFVSIKSLARLGVLVLGSAVLLMYPLKSYTIALFERVPKLQAPQVYTLGFVLSLVQQVLLSYSLLIALLIAQPGYEASTLSLPTFTIHLAHLCLRQHVMDYLDMSSNQRHFFQALALALFVYCFCVLINFNRTHISNAAAGGSTDAEKISAYKDYIRSSYSLGFTRVYGGSEPKSPWELHSEVSNDQEAL